jgi:cytochrome c
LYNVPKIHLPLAITLIFAAFGNASAAGEVANGATVFQQCGACHSAEKGKTIFGPSLYNVIGRPAGSIADFQYSPAMQEAARKGLIWTPQNVINYLQDPHKFLDDFAGDPDAPNKMPFSLADPKERADVVAYLQSLGAK